MNHPSKSVRTQIDAESSDDDLSVIKFLKIVHSYRYLVIGTAVAVLTMSVVIALLMTPIYRAEILLATVEENPSAGALGSLVDQFGGLAALAGAGMPATTGLGYEALATLGSRGFIEAFIRDYDQLPVLFEELWDPDNQQWDTDVPEEAPTLSDGYLVFSEEIMKVSENKTTGLVTLAIEWKDRELAAEWANRLVQLVNERLRTRAIEEADRSIRYLNQELEKTSVLELQQAIYRLIENHIRTRTLANVREEFAFKVIDPALPLDPDKFIRPNRGFIIGIGLILGLMVGVFSAFFVYSIKRLKLGFASDEIG